MMRLRPLTAQRVILGTAAAGVLVGVAWLSTAGAASLSILHSYRPTFQPNGCVAVLETHTVTETATVSETETVTTTNVVTDTATLTCETLTVTP